MSSPATDISSSPGQSPVYISGADVRRLVSMSDLAEALHPAFHWFSTGRVVQPVRETTLFNDEHHNGYI